VATPEHVTVVDIALRVLITSGRIILENFDADDEGIKHLDMVESAVSALHQLATDQGVADEIVKEHESMTVLIYLLALDEVNNSEDELLMREIMGLIYQLSKQPENAKIVEGYGPTEYIAGALRSQHKSIATYASGILKNLEKDKPLEYQRQLDTEINSAIGNEVLWANDGLEPELFNEMYNYGNLDIGHDNQGWERPSVQLHCVYPGMVTIGRVWLMQPDDSALKSYTEVTRYIEKAYRTFSHSYHCTYVAIPYDIPNWYHNAWTLNDQNQLFHGPECASL
uniref:RIH_assoc domain-containing protein n=1 Tax=Steinernema glaseri TaxID=37863 RepID=A0A1I8AFD0_9BILA